jgi:hypothetical protein
MGCIETWIADSGISGPNGLLLMASVVPRVAKRPPSLFMEDYLFRLVREHVAGVEPDLTTPSTTCASRKEGTGCPTMPPSRMNCAAFRGSGPATCSRTAPMACSQA